jgi:HD-GYP domain-containing protein (c-di-GMP phosphodiesterase class II)
MTEQKPPDDHSVKPEEPSRRISIDDFGLTAAVEPEKQTEAPREFLFAWFQLFRTAQIHAIDNKALARPLEKFVDVSSSIISSEDSISFQAKEGALFVNSVKPSLSSEEYYEAAEPIFKFFEEHGMGGFVIEGALNTDKVRRLLSILVYSPTSDREFSKVQAKLEEADLPIRINKSLGIKETETGAVLERRTYTFLTYSKLVVLYRSFLAEKAANPTRRQYLVKKICRTVEALVDICKEDDHTFLSVSSVKSGEAYLPHHAANVAVLAIALGEKLGLSKVQLADLGMAAVFSDIGLRDVPHAVLDKKDKLEFDERESMERHTLLGVQFLLDERRYTKPLLWRILVAFEHHRHVDGKGYPRLTYTPSLFSRIATIADSYDALTTERPWRPAYLPDEALGLMLAESGKKFDSRLLKIFVNTLGLYPVGTLVRLTSGQIGVVTYSRGEAERMTHPIVAVLGPGGALTQTLDLMEKDPAGKYLQAIASTEHPEKYGLTNSNLLKMSLAS